MRLSSLGGLRTAIVHEWVDAYAGSEQVFEAIAQEFPSADLYALTRTPGVELEVGGRPIRTTVLDHRRLRDRRALTLPLMPLAWRGLGRGDYDLVISSTHAFAHANRLVRLGGQHLAYVHTPARYLWSSDIDTRGASRWLGPAKSLLRRVDLDAVGNVNALAANSSTVAGRIQTFWQRPATVIPPPVRVEFFAAHGRSPSRDYILGVGRWIPYKHLDLVIKAGELAGLPVKIAGRGPEEGRLRGLAAKSAVDVEIIASPSDEALRELYAHAACLVFPTVEDFGIVPVEAQAAGTPVVAIRQGGALDTVLDGVSGILVHSLDTRELADGVGHALNIDARACLQSAQRFSREAFALRLHEWVDGNGTSVPLVAEGSPTDPGKGAMPPSSSTQPPEA